MKNDTITLYDSSAAEYEYKVAMYVYKGQYAFFSLAEREDGALVPTSWTCINQTDQCYRWGVGLSIRVMEYNSENGKYPDSNGINVYWALAKQSSSFREEFSNEAAFWKNVICIYFYIKSNAECTITAFRKSQWRRNKLCNFIKRIHIPNNYTDTEFKEVVQELINGAHNYANNPRKTPVDVEEFRKDESIGKHRFPWSIDLYKGEKRLLIIPYLDHVGGFSRQPDQMVILDENAESIEIGNGILNVVQILKTSPRLVGNTQGYRLATKYKGWKTFSKMNSMVSIRVTDDHSYHFTPCECIVSNGIYKNVGPTLDLGPDSTPEMLGNAILKCFRYFTNKKGKPGYNPYPPKDIELLDGSTLTITPPKDKHFADCDDCHAAEIYQCYSYLPQEDAESSADFFVGIAPELDCNLSPENIQHAWENLYGKAEYFEVSKKEHGLFKLHVEMKNKKTHRISYLLQMTDDLILECSMDVHQPNRRKKLDETLSVLFEEFASSCKM